MAVDQDGQRQGSENRRVNALPRLLRISSAKSSPGALAWTGPVSFSSPLARRSPGLQLPRREPLSRSLASRREGSLSRFTGGLGRNRRGLAGVFRVLGQHFAAQPFGNLAECIAFGLVQPAFIAGCALCSERNDIVRNIRGNGQCRLFAVERVSAAAASLETGTSCCSSPAPGAPVNILPTALGSPVTSPIRATPKPRNPMNARSRE